MFFPSTPLLILVSLLTAGQVFSYRIKVDFHDGEARTFDVPRGNLTADELLGGHRRAVVFGEESHYDKRQVCTSYTRTWYELVGDGNPHQNYEITEIAGTLMSCPGSVTQGYEHTTEWSLSFDTDLVLRDMTFGTLGLGVSESSTQSVSMTYDCDGIVNDPSEICGLHYAAVTAVTVKFFSETTCGSWIGPTEEKGVGVVYLPNANQAGTTHGMGANFGSRNIIQCRGGTVDRKVGYHCGPKATSDWFRTHELGPWNDQWLAAMDPLDCVAPIEGLKFT